MRANPKKLRARLDWLWANRTSPLGGATADYAKWRYVPRAFIDRGSGWGVFDRLQGRFLTDAQVVAVPMAQLREASHLS